MSSRNITLTGNRFDRHDETHRTKPAAFPALIVRQGLNSFGGYNVCKTKRKRSLDRQRRVRARANARVAERNMAETGNRTSRRMTPRLPGWLAFACHRDSTQSFHRLDLRFVGRAGSGKANPATVGIFVAADDEFDPARSTPGLGQAN